MDNAVEVMLPPENSALQPVQLQTPPAESLMANLNNQPVQKYIILHGDQLVQSGSNFIWVTPDGQITSPSALAQPVEKTTQAIDPIIQCRKKQQSMLRTLDQVANPQVQRQASPKLCPEELSRMFQVHQQRIISQQEMQHIKLDNSVLMQQQVVNKPIGVDASVGTDTPMELDDIVPEMPPIIQTQAVTIRPRTFQLGQPSIIRIPLRGARPDSITKSPQPVVRPSEPLVLYRVRMSQPESPIASTSTDVSEIRVNPNIRSVSTLGSDSLVQRTTIKQPITTFRAGGYQKTSTRSVTPRSATPLRQYSKMPQILQRPTRPARLLSPSYYEVVKTPPTTPAKTIPIDADLVQNPSSSSNAEKTTSPVNKEPVSEKRYVNGYLAICPFCGFSNLDFSKCERCKRKLPENVKKQPIIPVYKTSNAQKMTNNETSVLVADKTFVPKLVLSSPPMKKPKKVEEPEIFLLSSDEEDNTQESSPNEASSTLQTLPKEPVYTAEEKLQIHKEPEINVPDEPAEPFTMMIMKALRVGNYTAEGRKPVYISSEGIHFTAPSSIYGSDVKIFIKKSSLKAVLVYYSEKEPIVVIYPTRGTAVRIRSLLDMNNEDLLFYDPCSNVQAFRRLVLYVEPVTEDNKLVLRNELGGLLVVIDDAEKKALMTCVYETVHMPLADEKLLNFKNFGLSKSDYACLAVESYINDLIIDFYVQYLYERKMTPIDRERTHIFSTFFYNRLTETREEESSKDKPAEKRHKRVKKWTRKTNIFEKDFIIIPINENSHWFLAVICFPYLTGPVGFEDNQPVLLETNQAKKSPTKSSMQIGNTTITHCRPAVNNNNEDRILVTCSDRDEAEAEDDLSETEGDTEELISTPEPSLPEIPLLGTPEQDPKPKKPQAIKQPCILIFDSLRGSGGRSRVVATLRDYLTVEYKTQTGCDRAFNRHNCKGSVVKVPQQDNYSDCGLFVLQYVESFFENPLTDYRLPIRYLQNWFGEKIHNKRKEVAELIQSLMIEQGCDPSLMNLPDLAARTQSLSDDIEEDADMELDEHDESDNLPNSQDSTTLKEIDDTPNPPTCTTPVNPTQLVMVKHILPGHGPADGQTRQTLKSIRIQRPTVRASLQSDAQNVKLS